jgi:hypothetical protein
MNESVLLRGWLYIVCKGVTEPRKKLLNELILRCVSDLENYSRQLTLHIF